MPPSEQENVSKFIEDREPFLRFLKEWESGLPSLALTSVLADAGGPDNVAIVCTDLTEAFVGKGRLASPRVATIVPPIVELFKLAHSLGVEDFVLTQDAHPADSLQFRAYGPHSIPGSGEEETTSLLMTLPFSDLFLVIPKQNLSPGIDTGFPDWLSEHEWIRRFIVVGDCTDLCVYQVAMYLRLRANKFKIDYEVIVPEDCVDTFETEYNAARELNVMPHDADLLHPLFLYHMALNGIRVVSSVTG